MLDTHVQHNISLLQHNLLILIQSLNSGCVTSSAYTYEGEKSLSKIESSTVRHGVRVPIDNEVL